MNPTAHRLPSAIPSSIPPNHHPTRLASLSLILPSLLIAACSLGGCVTTNQDRKANTVQSTGVVFTEVTKAKQQLALSTESLTGLRDANERADLDQFRKVITSSQVALDAALARVEASSAAAIETGRKQSVAWQEKANAFTDSGLRAASQKREGTLRDTVAALEASRTRLRTAGLHYHDQATQIIAALDLDRSYQGTRSIIPSLERLVAAEAPLREALSQVAEKALAVSTANSD